MTPPYSVPKQELLQCPRCRNGLFVGQQLDLVKEECPMCRGRLELNIYPRLFRSPSERQEAQQAMDGEAKCSFYAELKASHICEECGSFLSDRATVMWGGRPYCVPCLYRLREVDKNTDFIARVTVYENVALFLVTWLAPLTLFTAPLALIILLRHRKVGKRFVPGGKGTWWLAMVLTILWLVAWTALLVIWIALIVDNA